MGKLDYLTKQSLLVRDKTPKNSPACEKKFHNHQPCYYVIVHIDKDYAEWRCTKCLKYIATDLPVAGQRSLF